VRERRQKNKTISFLYPGLMIMKPLTFCFFLLYYLMMNSGSSKGYNSHSLQVGVNKELLKKIKDDFWKKAESKGKILGASLRQ